MTAVVGRRDFLRGRLFADPVRRPPHAITEARFLARCNGCGDCVEACPQHILSLVDRTPQIDFGIGKGGCTFCDACTTACPTGALNIEKAAPWRWLAEIVYPNCLPYNRMPCRTCADACETDAIRFHPMTRGKEIALIDAEACTGCGACKSVCPVSAIRLAQAADDKPISVQ